MKTSPHPMRPHPMSDAGLWHTLKHYDPAEKPSPGSLAALEARILAQLDRQQQEAPAAGLQMPAWLLRQGWTTRAALMASALIVALGFVAGQVTYARRAAPQLAMSPSLLVLANETALLPTALIATGDTDDDDE